MVKRRCQEANDDSLDDKSVKIGEFCDLWSVGRGVVFFLKFTSRGVLVTENEVKLRHEE
jgi:hypothetical protein